ncbi:hypothetical protein BJX99DRAFT_184637 [Aspergillus californicus]
MCISHKPQKQERRSAAQIIFVFKNAWLRHVALLDDASIVNINKYIIASNGVGPRGSSPCGSSPFFCRLVLFHFFRYHFPPFFCLFVLVVLTRKTAAIFPSHSSHDQIKNRSSSYCLRVLPK